MTRSLTCRAMDPTRNHFTSPAIPKMYAPIVELRGTSPKERQLYAKLEYVNQSGTIKERLAARLLQCTVNLPLLIFHALLPKGKLIHLFNAATSIPAGSILVVGSSGVGFACNMSCRTLMSPACCIVRPRGRLTSRLHSLSRTLRWQWLGWQLVNSK